MGPDKMTLYIEGEGVKIDAITYVVDGYTHTYYVES